MTVEASSKYLVSEDVFSNHEDIYDWVRYQAEFEDLKGPDGVVYPDVCQHVPGFMVNKIGGMLAELFRSEMVCNLAFFRRSMEGVKAPNLVHSDLEMGAVSVMYYLTPDDLSPDTYGTAFMTHKQTGMFRHPANDVELAALHADQNDLTKWERAGFVAGVANRMAVFDAGMLHLAEPVGGFGKNKDDARVVMTAFFSFAS